MKPAVRIILVLLSVAMSVLFLYSAYTKTIPIQSFEYTMVDFAALPWLAAAIGARFFVGLEAAIGGLMILHLFGNRKWVFKVALILLAVFSAYLVYLWAKEGDDVNCGCFGDTIWMSPSTSLLKNIGMLVVLFVLNKYHRGFKFKRHNQVSVILFVVLLALPYIIFPLPERQPEWMSEKSFKLDMSSFYKAGKVDAPKSDLKQGKHVIAFLSLNCPHCRIAAYKMHVMKEKNPDLPFYFILLGPDKDLKSFWKETKAEHIPHTRLEAEEFIKLIGNKWPVIYYLNNGVVEAQANYVTMDQASIELWLNETEK